MKASNFSGDRAFKHLVKQVELGIRAPGTPGHEAVLDLYEEVLAPLGLSTHRQRWDVPLSKVPEGEVTLTNLLCRIPGAGQAPTTLVSSHYDSRWIADNDPDPALVDRPIPGANDGGSGTAIMLELARCLTDHAPAGDVILGFMDGEDLGHIDEHPFAVGSRKLVAEPGAYLPDQVIALDMVGGEGMRLNLELNSLTVIEQGAGIFLELFSLGRALGLAPFAGGSPHTIYSDHGPWLEAGVPAVLLIDIEYPQWHTHQDLPEHCSVESLEAVGRVLEAYLGDSRTQ